MSDSEAEEITDLSSPDVTTKYMTASTITNKALAMAVELAKPGKDIYELCREVDGFIEAETGKVYNKKGAENKDKDKIEKGVAFPTCVSVNERVGHFSPLKGESEALKEGDLAKLDLGCHIDGYITQAAHTVLVGNETVSDKRADVTHAAWTTAEAVLRLLKAGNTNTDVTRLIKKCSDEFKCNPVEGVTSHELKRHVVDSDNAILNLETPEHRSNEFNFGVNEVYCLDVLVSSGEGKGKDSELRTTVFRRALENNYTLKTAKARQFLSEVSKRFPTLCFTLSAFDETVGRIGASESTRHELLHQYPVQKDKAGEFVAQFKYTVLVLPGGTKKVTGMPFTQKEQLKSEFVVQDEEIKTLLATSANPKKAKKKKKAEEAAK